MVKRIIAWFRNLFARNVVELPASYVPSYALPEDNKRAEAFLADKKNRPKHPTIELECASAHCKVGKKMVVPLGTVQYSHRECRKGLRQRTR